MSQRPILVAIADPVLHPEAMHVAAATGRPIVDTNDPREIARHLGHCAAVLVCGETAASLSRTTRARIFLLCPDPGPPDWKLAVECRAEQVFVMPAQAPELLTVLGRDDSPVNSGTVVGFVPAVGGAGATILAAVLARMAARYVSTVIIDADAYSGGLDLVFGIEDIPGARWGDIDLGSGDIAGSVFDALPATSDGIRVLSAARIQVPDLSTLAVEQFGAAITNLQASAELTIVDCSQSSISEVAPLVDLVVVVIPAQVRPTAAAAACVARMRAQHAEVVAVVRHMQWSGLDVSDIERICGIPVIAEVGTAIRLPKILDTQGLPLRIPKQLAGAARAVLEALR